MWQIISALLCGLLTSVTVYTFSRIVLEKKSNKNLIIIVLGIIISAIIYGSCYLVFKGIVKTIIMLINTIYIYTFVEKINLRKSIILSLLYIIILIIPDLIELFFITHILHLSRDFCYNNYAGSLLSTFIVNLLFLIIILIVRSYIKKILEKEIENITKIILFFILVFICIGLMFYNFVEKFRFSNDIFVYLITIIVLIVTLVSLIKQSIINIKITNDYDRSLEFMTTYEEEVENQRTLRHETKNEFLTIRAKIFDKEKESEIINYIDEILGDTYSVKNEKYAKFGYLPANGIKGLCYFKVQKAEELGINVSINISKKIKKSTVFDLDLKQQREFAKILGVFIDNAIEASSESKDKELGIEAYSNLENEFRMIISNTYNNEIDEEKIGKENFTTKGKNRGHGLLLVNQIVQKNNIFETKRNIKNDIYSQTIIVKKK